MGIKLKLQSMENASLIRKFSGLFVLISLMPFLIIVYFYTQYRGNETVIFSQSLLLRLIFLTGLGALIGFFLMRKSIVKLQKIIKQTSEVLRKEIPDIAVGGGDESEISQLVKSFNEVTKTMDINIKRLEASKRMMQDVLTKLAVGLSSSKTIDTFMALIVDITTQALEAKTGMLMVLDEEKQELYVKSAYGVDSSMLNTRLKVGEESAGWVAKHKKPLLIPELHHSNQPVDHYDPFTPPLLCAPMIYQDRLVGVLSVAGKINGNNFKDDELMIISNLATQTAVAVENERLHADAEKTYLGTISALAMAVEARDYYSRGHSDRVAIYSVKVAQKLGLDKTMIQDIKDAAQLHDVGKIGISDEILRKPEQLNEEERVIMCKHPVIGEGIVKPSSVHRLSGIIRHHHELYNGSGYPDNLKGEDIPLGARILAVTDTFDAMTTDRPYRKGMSAEKAKEELQRLVNVHYDPKVVEAFLSLSL